MDKKYLIDRKIKLEDWMIREDGSLLLLEGTIIKEQSIKIYIHSNERTRHHRPHVHACFNDNEYVISIDDNIELLEPEKPDKYSRYLIKCYFTSCLQDFRKEWNSICSNYKFVQNDNGEYVCA